MKKISLFFLAAIVCGNTTFAQMGIPKIGIDAGINIASSNLNKGGKSFTSSSLLGLHAGAFVEFSANKNFKIQPELQYNQMGSKTNLSFFNRPVADGIVHLDYLSIPVLAKYKFTGTGFGVYVGPQLDLLLSAKAKLASGGSSTNFDIKDSYNSTNFSGVFGVEYASFMGFVASARYQAGLGSSTKSNIFNITSTNNAFTLTVGYAF